MQQDAGRAVARGVHDVEPPSGHLDAVADGRDPAELGGYQAGERLVGAVGDAQADPLQLVGAGGAVGGVEGAALVVRARRGEVRCLVRIVLVPHLTDDLLDDVLHGGDARGAAVLVDDDGHRALPGEPVEEPVDGQGLGYEERLAHQIGHGTAPPEFRGHGEDVLDVRDADDRVEVAAVDGEPGQARGPGRVRHVLAGGLRVERHDLDARRHHVLRGEVREVQGAHEQLGGVRLEGALLGGVAGQGHQFLRSARGGQLLGGFDADAAYRPVRGVVQVRDEGAERGAEQALGRRDALGDGQRRRDRPVLGDELADDHQEDGRQSRADDQRGRGGGGPGEPETLQGARDQLGDGRLGEHADDQIGHGDAELGAGELEGQVPYGLEGAGGAPLTALDGALEAGTLDGGEGELGSDERTAGQREQHRHGEQEHFGHRVTSVP